MSSFDRIVEEKIKAAMEAGEFENLRGKGKPLNLDQDPMADPAWLMASNLLKEQGFSLPWIELRKEIETDLEKARRRLGQAHLQRQPGDEAAWEKTIEVFNREITALNRRIISYNLQVPDLHFQRTPVNVARELVRLESLPAGSTSTGPA